MARAEDSDFGDEEVLDQEEEDSEDGLILAAVGFGMTSTILVGAGELMREAIETLDANTLEELPVSSPREDGPTHNIGLFVWEGVVTHTDDDEYEFDGEWRRALAQEAALMTEANDPWPEGPGTFYL